MQKDTYKICFNSPGFLGDADQQSAWRTPPFKALLQHWWRVAVAKQYGYDWQSVREAEGRLFGHAWLDNGSWVMRSRVRLNLTHQNSGTLKSWENSPANYRVTHSEVTDNAGNLRPMAPETYLAYGPLHFRDGLVHPPAINANEENQLTLIYPKSEQVVLRQSLQLLQWFGTLGGRSRNGWGSINLQGSEIKSELDLSTLQLFSRPLAECLILEWPHAIGSDDKGLLIWKTPEQKNWRLVMKDLAQTKIKFRTNLAFPNAAPNGFQPRHLLAYPVTNHRVNVWGNNGRLANQLRFKIARTESGFVGIIVHLPCAMPNQMSGQLGGNAPSIPQQVAIWQSVHRSLDTLNDQGLEIKRINP